MILSLGIHAFVIILMILKFMNGLLYPSCCPKFWELSHCGINTADHLQHCMSLSPSWCIMCKAHAESPVHLFMYCPFASHFWNNILDTFGWSIAYSNNIFDILDSLFWWGTPLLALEDSLVAIRCLFFWTSGVTVISVSFKIQFPLLTLFDLVLFTAFYWCKIGFPFKNFSHLI